MFCCKQCGECCRVHEGYTFINVVLSNKDIINISKGLGITVQEFIKKYCVLKELCLGEVYKKYFLKAHIGSCVFLRDSKCIIHKFKPLQCRLAPMLLFQKTDFWKHLKCCEDLHSENHEEYDVLFIRELLKEYDF